MGGSNGGLLVAAVMEQCPDLFAVALLGVGVLEVLRFHRFTGGVVGTAEYGSSEDAMQFGYLYRYSPLHNVIPGACYPATLISTADHDDRVIGSSSQRHSRRLRGCDRPGFSEPRGRHRTPSGRPTNGSPSSPTAGRSRSQT